MKKSGSWYTYDGDQLGQARRTREAFLLNNPDIALAIETQIKQKLASAARLCRRLQTSSPSVVRPDERHSWGRSGSGRPHHPSLRRCIEEACLDATGSESGAWPGGGRTFVTYRRCGRMAYDLDAPPAGVSRIDESDAGTPSDRHPARGVRGSSATASRSAVPLLVLRAARRRAERRHRQRRGGVARRDPSVRRRVARAQAAGSVVVHLRVAAGVEGCGARQRHDRRCDRRLLSSGYLDDSALAGVLVTSGVERKGQGRVALSRALAQRAFARRDRRCSRRAA